MERIECRVSVYSDEYKVDEHNDWATAMGWSLPCASCGKPINGQVVVDPERKCAWHLNCNPHDSRPMVLRGNEVTEEMDVWNSAGEWIPADGPIGRQWLIVARHRPVDPLVATVSVMLEDWSENGDPKTTMRALAEAIVSQVISDMS